MGVCVRVWVYTCWIKLQTNISTEYRTARCKQKKLSEKKRKAKWRLERVYNRIGECGRFQGRERESTIYWNSRHEISVFILLYSWILKCVYVSLSGGGCMLSSISTKLLNVTKIILVYIKYVRYVVCSFSFYSFYLHCMKDNWK